MNDDLRHFKASDHDDLGAFRLIEEGAAGLAFIAVCALAAILLPVIG